MVDGNLRLTERQKRALVAQQFELQMPKYPLKILDRLTNYRYRMYDEKLKVEELATTLAHSFDFYEYRMNLRGGIQLIVCQLHNSALPVWCLELETTMLYKPGTAPDMDRPIEGRKRRTAYEELEDMEPRTRQRYLDLRQRYLKPKVGRPWMS